MRELGLRIAAASSPKNAGLMLGQIDIDTFAEEQGLDYGFLTPNLRLLDLLDVDISGRDFARGKPHSEIFLTAAGQLDLPTHECVVVEDAVAGVEAAKAGGMAALGVARAEDAGALRAPSADLVVTSLDDVDVDGLPQGSLVTRHRSAPRP